MKKTLPTLAGAVKELYINVAEFYSGQSVSFLFPFLKGSASLQKLTLSYVREAIDIHKDKSLFFEVLPSLVCFRELALAPPIEYGLDIRSLVHAVRLMPALQVLDLRNCRMLAWWKRFLRRRLELQVTLRNINDEDSDELEEASANDADENWYSDDCLDAKETKGHEDN